MGKGEGRGSGWMDGLRGNESKVRREREREAVDRRGDSEGGRAAII